MRSSVCISGASSEEEVRIVIKTGETIEDYPADFPYPSRLVLGWHGLRPVHVVVADNIIDRENHCDYSL
jgi:hypothetical protein